MNESADRIICQVMPCAQFGYISILCLLGLADSSQFVGAILFLLCKYNS